MHIMGIDPTQVVPGNVAPPFALGAIAFNTTNAGDSKGYMFVKDNGLSGGIQLENLVVIIRYDGIISAVATSTSAPGTGQGRPVGISRSILPLNAYGWVQIYGQGLIRVAATTSAYTQLNTTGNPGVLDSTSGVGSRAIDGISIHVTNSGGQGPILGFLSWPKIGRTL